MEKQVKISVIVPIYNVEKYLKECIDSLLNQTLQDIEIILLDDGGKDTCPQIIDEYAQKDSRIVPVHKQNGGYGNTCNVGLEKASGEYVAILEPDDFIEPDMYETLYNEAKKDDADIVKSDFYKYYDIENEKHKSLVKLCAENEKCPTESFTIDQWPKFLALHPSIWTCIYKRSFLNENKIRFIEAPGAGWTDNPFQVQTMCLAKKIRYINKAFYYWRVLDKTDAKALKNYTLPFLRSDEIHAWLDNNNINNESILSSLYERELSYISIVLRMDNISDIEDCKNKIIQMCKRMDSKIVRKSKNIRNCNKKLYFNCTHFMPLVIAGSFRRKIISLRLNRKEIAIYLFGKELVLYRKEYKNESDSN